MLRIVPIFRSFRGWGTDVVPALGWVLHLVMRSDDTMNVPAVLPQSPHDLPTVHAGIIHRDLYVPPLRRASAVGILALP